MSKTISEGIYSHQTALELLLVSFNLKKEADKQRCVTVGATFIHTAGIKRATATWVRVDGLSQEHSWESNPQC